MNETVKDFFLKNNIDPNEISSDLSGRLMTPYEVNDIVYNYGVRTSKKDKIISIADIVGYDYSWRDSSSRIAYSLDSFFDRNGDGYHRRSIGLLEYTAENIVTNIDYTVEPIVVEEMDDNKYVIATNGLHRYTVLRIFYLSECAKAKGNKEKLSELRDKYKMPLGT